MQHPGDRHDNADSEHEQASPARTRALPPKHRDHESEYSRLLYMLELIDAQIALADAKAHLVLGANAILLATWELKQGVLRDVLAGNTSVLEGGSVLFALLMMGMVLLSGIYALRSTLPRIITESSEPNPFFFGHIHQMSADAFIDLFLAQTEEEVRRNILIQIHAKSGIANRKFVLLRDSMVALIGAFGFWILSQLAHALGS